jgi:hypothetical protein
MSGHLRRHVGFRGTGCVAGAVPRRVLADSRSLACRVSHACCPGLGESTRRHAHGGRVAGGRNFAWVYELTPEGLKLQSRLRTRKLTARRLDRAIIAVLAVVLTYVVVDKFWVSKHLSMNELVAAAAPLFSPNQRETCGPVSESAKLKPHGGE